MISINLFSIFTCFEFESKDLKFIEEYCNARMVYAVTFNWISSETLFIRLSDQLKMWCTVHSAALHNVSGTVQCVVLLSDFWCKNDSALSKFTEAAWSSI